MEIQYKEEATNAINKYSDYKKKIENLENEIEHLNSEVNIIRKQFNEWLSINNINNYPLEDKNNQWFNVCKINQNSIKWDSDYLHYILTPEQLSKAKKVKKISLLKINKITYKTAIEYMNKLEYNIPNSIEAEE